MFTSWHCDFERESNKKVLQVIGGWQDQIKKNSNAWVKAGVTEFDKGNKKAALESYKMAMDLWPKNPWANYEMGLTMMMDSINGMFDDERPCDGYFKKARKYDPFQKFAYQGTKEISQGMLVIMKEIEPALKRMTSGKVTSEDMEIFGDGCVKIKEYELAAYGYHCLLHMTLDRTKGFKEEFVTKFTTCLDSLDANEAARVIEEQFREYNRLLRSKNNDE